jgi:signal transduction histidine kinase
LRDKNRLFYIALSVLLPPFAIFIFAIVDIVYSKKNIETFVRLYVEHFTEGAVRHMDKGGAFAFRDGINIYNPFQPFDDFEYQNSFGHYPTYLAILTDTGEFIYGSEKIKKILNAHDLNPSLYHIGEFESAGEKFTVAKLPALSGAFWVVGAVSWRDMPGTTAISVFLWPALIVLMTFWSAITISKLVRKVLRPISCLEKAVSSLKWGYETLEYDIAGANPQVKQMYDALVKVSHDVVRTMRTNRNYMNDLVNVQEDERTKISRDIHDGPLQDVTALIQRIRLARRPDNTDEDTVMELDLAEKIAFATVKEMRALCDFLNPPWLELGLVQALTELTERQSVQYGVKIFLGMEDELDVSDSVTLAFFRVIQEAITNSVRHGEAKNIWIDITRNDDGGIDLTVQDDGHGFDIKEGDTAELRTEGHRGLSNMEERMAIIGGRLKIISYKGEGTCVRCLLP